MSETQAKAEAKARKDEIVFYLGLFGGAAGLAAAYVIILAVSLAA